MLSLSPQIEALNPLGTPDCSCAVVRPVTPAAFSTFPTPNAGEMPNVCISQ